MKPSTYINIKSELSSFVKLCKEYNVIPTTDDLNEMIDFIKSNELLNESFTTNEYEMINEGLFSDLGVSKESVVGLFSHEKNPDKPGGISYIKFLFKRGKVNSELKKELSLQLQRIDNFSKLVNLKKQLADLEGSELPAMSNYIPKYI